jgi:opacity protein-like surface antigen
MKKLLLLLVTVILSTSATYAKVHVEINFGKPKKDCSGWFGVCSVLANAVNYENSEKSIKATLDVNSNKHLVLEIQKTDVTPLFMENIANTKVFINEDEFSLSNEICKLLGLKNYSIPKGKFEVIETENTYFIELN